MEKNKKSSLHESRRSFLGQIAGIPLAAVFGKLAFQSAAEVNIDDLPKKNEFEIKGTFLNAAYTHPMSKGSRHAIHTYLDERMQNGRVKNYDMGADRKECMELFSKMINADKEELAWIPSTSAGENFIAAGLSLQNSRSRVVTDAYHFEGSLHMYNELAKQGLDLHILRPRNNGIDYDELEKAITPKTKLVAVSSVSYINGFQHDLKKVCEMAHAKNALVYADIIHSAGAVPMDVKETSVDFCACSTFKWLMGDFGVGFLYVKKDKLDFLQRSQIGYRQLKNFTSHVFPYEMPGDSVFDADERTDTGGHFEVGTLSNAAVAGLKYSLNLLSDIGVNKIQQYRQSMIDRLQQQLPSLGFEPMTPLNSTSPIVSFAFKDAGKILKQKLAAADINIQLYENRIRVSPSFFNDMDDVNKLIQVLSKK